MTKVAASEGLTCITCNHKIKINESYELTDDGYIFCSDCVAEAEQSEDPVN